MHKKWSTTTAEQTVQRRREEDRRAAEILGAKTAHLDFLDAIYRRTADGEPLYGDPVGAPVRAEDLLLTQSLALELGRRLRLDDNVVSLLGVGRHADHVVVRRAAEGLSRALLYVPDFPYVTNYPETVAPSVEGLESRVFPVSEAAVLAWIRSVRAYASQLEAVFGESSPDEVIRSYWAPLQGIRLWSRPT